MNSPSFHAREGRLREEAEQKDDVHIRFFRKTGFKLRLGAAVKTKHRLGALPQGAVFAVTVNSKVGVISSEFHERGFWAWKLPQVLEQSPVWATTLPRAAPREFHALALGSAESFGYMI